MTRTRTAAVLTALLLAVTGCSGEDEPESGPETPTASADETVLRPPGTAVRLASPDSSGYGYTSCVPAGAGGPWIVWTELRVVRPATFDDIVLVGVESNAIEVTDVVYTARPAGRQRFTAVLEGAEPPRRFQEQVGWADRRPVDGTTVLDPGRYYVFLVLDVSGPGAFDDAQIGWTEQDGEAGVTDWGHRQEFARRC